MRLIECFLEFLFTFLVPFMCWRASPPFVRAPRILMIFIDFLVRALRTMAMRTIWPPWKYKWIITIEEVFKAVGNRSASWINTPSKMLPSIVSILEYGLFMFCARCQRVNTNTNDTHTFLRTKRHFQPAHRAVILECRKTNKYNYTISARMRCLCI